MLIDESLYGLSSNVSILSSKELSATTLDDASVVILPSNTLSSLVLLTTSVDINVANELSAPILEDSSSPILVTTDDMSPSTTVPKLFTVTTIVDSSVDNLVSTEVKSPSTPVILVSTEVISAVTSPVISLANDVTCVSLTDSSVEILVVNEFTSLPVCRISDAKFEDAPVETCPIKVANEPSADNLVAASLVTRTPTELISATMFASLIEPSPILDANSTKVSNALGAPSTKLSIAD